jgi:hypothetical protein
VVVVVLVLVWVVALLPIALKKRSEWELSSSISQFRHRRRALDRLAPSAGPAEGAPMNSPAPPHGRRRDQTARQRRRALCQRRRRTLTALAATVVGGLVFGTIPALQPLWYVALVAGIALIGYLAALVYVRRLEELAAERDRKVIELAERARRSAIAPVQPRPAFVIIGAGS